MPKDYCLNSLIYFFLMSVRPSRSGKMTTSTLGSFAIKSLKARMP